MKYSILDQIGGLSTDEFIKEYWQKKPFLAKQAFVDFQSPISADELAGLSLEDEVNSRLIIKSNKRWQVQHGPLPEDTFAHLPDTNWTLLVQHVDSLDPEVNALLGAFRFIPNWRLDDIMMSYAADRGSVGPHFDYYDVFLLQAEGKRRWKLGQRCDKDTPLLPDQDMKILADFQQEEEYLLEPGDMLYIPPGISHWGIAEGECTTISIGFRAPSHAELLLEFAQEKASQLDEDQRYRDTNLQVQNSSGEIKAEVIENIATLLAELTNNPLELAETFGKMMTQPNNNVENNCEQLELRADQVRLSPYARCAWHEHEQHALLFINGEQWSCSKDLAIQICSYEDILISSLNHEDKALILSLADLGVIENHE